MAAHENDIHANGRAVGGVPEGASFSHGASQPLGNVSERLAYERAKRRAVTAWGIVGVVAVVVLAVRGLALVWPAVQLAVVGGVVGFMCSPVTNRLEDGGVPRGLAAFLALVLVIAAVVACLLLLGGPIVNQLMALLRSIPAYFAQLQAAVGEFWATYGTTETANVQSSVNQVVNSLSSMGTSLAGDIARTMSSGIVNNVSSMVGGFVTFFLGLILAFWLAKDYPVIVRELGTVIGPSRAQDMTLMLAVLSRSVGGYMRGTIISSIANGVLCYVGFAAIGHPFAGIMSIACGLFQIVPVVGPILSGGVAVVLALFTDPWMALWTLVIDVVATMGTSNVIAPIVMQSSVKVHPALSLLGLVVGSALGGPVGMVFAIPLTAALRGVFVYYFETTTGRQLVSYDGALFKSTPFFDENGTIMPTFDALDDDKFFESTRLVERASTPHVEAGERPEGMRRTIADLVVDAADDFTLTHLAPLGAQQDATDAPDTDENASQ